STRFTSNASSRSRNKIPYPRLRSPTENAPPPVSAAAAGGASRVGGGVPLHRRECHADVRCALSQGKQIVRRQQVLPGGSDSPSRQLDQGARRCARRLLGGETDPVRHALGIGHGCADRRAPTG